MQPACQKFEKLAVAHQSALPRFKAHHGNGSSAVLAMAQARLAQ
jgi:hypothetical protein